MEHMTQTPEEIRETTKQMCVEFIESFAKDYVDKWIKAEGDGAKAQGWAILQAAAALRDSGF